MVLLIVFCMLLIIALCVLGVKYMHAIESKEIYNDYIKNINQKKETQHKPASLQDYIFKDFGETVVRCAGCGAERPITSCSSISIRQQLGISKWVVYKCKPYCPVCIAANKKSKNQEEQSVETLSNNPESDASTTSVLDD